MTQSLFNKLALQHGIIGAIMAATYKGVCAAQCELWKLQYNKTLYKLAQLAA